MKKIMAIIAQAIKMVACAGKAVGYGAWHALDFTYRFITSDWYEEDEEEMQNSNRPRRDAGPRLAAKVIDATADVAATVGGAALKTAATVGTAALNMTGTIVNAVAAMAPKINIGGGGDGTHQLPAPHYPTSAAQSVQIANAIDGIVDLESKVKRDPRAIVFMYSLANAGFRKTVDTSVLGPNLRRWLHSLSDAEYTIIRDAGLRQTLDHLDGIRPLNGVMPAPRPTAGSRAEQTANVRRNLRDRLGKMPSAGANYDAGYDHDMHAA